MCFCHWRPETIAHQHFSFNVNAAYCLTEWLGLGFYFLKGNANWRLLLGLQLVPGVAMLAASFWMPFSPRWVSGSSSMNVHRTQAYQILQLIMKGRHNEALVILKRMHKGVLNDDEFYLREFHQIKAQIALDNEERLGFGAILRKKSYRHRLVLILTFSLFCQLTGIIPLQNYQVSQRSSYLTRTDTDSNELPGRDLPKTGLFAGVLSGLNRVSDAVAASVS